MAIYHILSLLDSSVPHKPVNFLADSADVEAGREEKGENEESEGGCQVHPVRGGDDRGAGLLVVAGH